MKNDVRVAVEVSTSRLGNFRICLCIQGKGPDSRELKNKVIRKLSSIFSYCRYIFQRQS